MNVKTLGIATLFCKWFTNATSILKQKKMQSMYFAYCFTLKNKYI